jgi:hypothetical protein
MTQPATSTCAACGAAGSGRFCSSCGAPRGASACRHCGGAVGPGARFCPGCGRGVGSGSAASGAPGDRTPWVIAGVAFAALLIVVLLMISRTTPAPVSVAAGEAGPAAGASDGGAPPDISNMSPRERFDRLYNRVMRAAQAGDEATVSRFTPMALMAYGQLDTLDADARYHAALLQVHSGDVAGPTALADTILAQQPGHLFGYIIRGTVARWQKDDKALARAYAGFLEHYDAEMKAARPEYGDHKVSVDEFHQQALQAKSTAAGT